MDPENAAHTAAPPSPGASTQTAGAQPAPGAPTGAARRMQEGLRLFGGALLLFTLWAFASNLATFVRGDRDSYPHQHLNLVIGSLGQICLISAILCNTTAVLAGPERGRCWTRRGMALLAVAILALFTGAGLLRWGGS